jgi:hypothetical protein
MRTFLHCVPPCPIRLLPQRVDLSPRLLDVAFALAGECLTLHGLPLLFKQPVEKPCPHLVEGVFRGKPAMLSRACGWFQKDDRVATNPIFEACQYTQKCSDTDLEKLLYRARAAHVTDSRPCPLFMAMGMGNALEFATQHWVVLQAFHVGLV